MNTQPLVSIVIPCFNDGAYIEETIASAKAQSYTNIEIIIVDDASTDTDTLEKLKQLQQSDTSLHIIFMETNMGPAVARNKAIESAKGRYILPLDSDDLIAPTYIEKAVDVLEKEQEVGIVYCQASLFGEKNENWELPSYSFPEILAGNMVFATALYRKSDWQKAGGYNENMRYGNEDYDFWLSLIELGIKVHRIEEILFHYRLKPTSRTTQLHAQKERELETFTQIFHNHQNLYQDNIGILFQTLHELKEVGSKKDEEIKKIHRDLQKRDDEIKKIHETLQKRDDEIKNLHSNLEKLSLKLHDIGEKLSYATAIVNLRDQQLALKNEQIEFLNSLTLKRRLKHQVKKLIPTKLLELFGFSAYVPLVLPTREFEEVVASSPAVPEAYRYVTPKLTNDIIQTIENFKQKPLISIVMPVYNVDPKWLKLAIASIENQWYPHWELCIADDKSPNIDTIEYLKSIKHPNIKIAFLEENLNISGATNAALELATGEYIALMDNDDEITPDALYEMVTRINQIDADFIYSDEDFIDTEGNCSNPHYKPDFSPDLLLSHNYITHFSCFKTSLLNHIGRYHAKFDGAQDYDLFLRLTEEAKTIVHIPKVLYHWRTLETSTSANSEAKPEAIERGRAVIQSALERRACDATVEHGNMHHYFRVKYTIKDNPLVSIIIPFKDKPELLDMCIHSILDLSTYQNYEIIGISNNSEEPETFTMMKQLEAKDSRVKFYEYNTEFNYADINNHAVSTYAKGEHILLLNNDIEVISPEWIESMLEHSQRKEIGCVGAKLYYPNDTVQHAGIIMGLGGYAGHSHKMYPRDNPGYFNRLNVIQNFSAVTAACLMVKKSIYQAINGLDDVHFKVAYNDVDFCLRVAQEGYYNLFTPYTEMYHHESISRGYETTPEKIARFDKEKDALLKRHHKILTEGDPFYNPNLCHDKEDFSICPKY